MKLENEILNNTIQTRKPKHFLFLYSILYEKKKTKQTNRNSHASYCLYISYPNKCAK
jgi:hypothetical protein